MNTSIIKEMSEKSLAGTITFPEVVRNLLEAGVESYKVDLIQCLKTFYAVEGKPYVERFVFTGPKVPAQFSAEAVVSAIRASQAGKITYGVFLDQIMKAGCSSYTAYLTGKKVIYSGRTGDSHTEHFPK